MNSKDIKEQAEKLLKQAQEDEQKALKLLENARASQIYAKGALEACELLGVKDEAKKAMGESDKGDAASDSNSLSAIPNDSNENK